MTKQGFIEHLPKAELHLHIEGTLEPELMMELAVRNGVDMPYASIEDLKAAYRFANLQDFLDLYYQGTRVLVEEQDFYDLTWAYLNRARGQNIVHTEIFFDPQAHTGRGIGFATVIDGIHRALQDGRRDLGVSSKLILSLLRHLSAEDAMDTLQAALPYKACITAVGLDSSELGNPPEKFSQVFARARAEGFLCVAHAGEEGPPDYVRQALDILHIDRLDHGNRALEDDALVRRLAGAGIALTVCPLSNLKLCVVSDMKEHPLKEMMARGLLVTVNSDDPAYFGGYLNENFDAVETALDLDRQELVQLVENSFRASFLNEAEKAAKLADLKACLESLAD